MYNKSELNINKGCERCNKNCNFRGLTTSKEQLDKPKYKCNSSK